MTLTELWRMLYIAMVVAASAARAGTTEIESISVLPWHGVGLYKIVCLVLTCWNVKFAI